jgi:N-acetylglucosaminyldiphosphoundecaprenol N-acetyl-beta-D-mannosaminyltransferase
MPILNAEFDPLTLPETADAVFDLVRARRRGWLCTVNVATLIAMRDDPRLQRFVDRAAIVVADGQPLVWCAPLFHGRLPERVAGIDLIDAICARASATGVGIYLLGSTETLLQRALANLRVRHPGLRIAGADGYFSVGEAAGRADAIAASGAGILLVGMGSPLQEEFIERHWGRLGAAVAIGVGGSFDVLAGARFRAPRPMRKAGLEWLVRLVQEPRRLLPRYAGTNTRFCLLIADRLVLRLKRWMRAT